MPKKKCDYCGKHFPSNYFGVALTTARKVYRRRKCRDCYRATKQILIEKHYAWLNEIKSKAGCSRCGTKDPRVLDFHHRKGEDKAFSIGGVRREVGFDKLKVEIEKCVIVCANCHRILHHDMREVKNGA